MKTYEIKLEHLFIENILYPRYYVYYYTDGILDNVLYHSNDGINGYILPEYTNNEPIDNTCKVKHYPNARKPRLNTFKPVYGSGGNLYFKHAYKVCNDLNNPTIERILKSQYNPHKNVWNNNLRHTIYLYDNGRIVIEFTGYYRRYHYVI